MTCPYCGDTIVSSGGCNCMSVTVNGVPLRALVCSPHRCPVCDGRGLVPAGFYFAVGAVSYSGSGTTTEKCRSCDGKGLVWR